MTILLPSTTTVEEANRHLDVAVLPVGSFEQHGEYLPLATDAMIASIIAQEVASQYDLFCLPPISIACSHEHADWKGTVSISSKTLHLMIDDIFTSLKKSGTSKLVLVNAHGGNYVLSNIVQEANVSDPCMSLFPNKHDWQTARDIAGLETSSHEDMHAGEIETSILLHMLPQVVRPGYDAADHVFNDRQHLLVQGMRPYTKSGVIGRPSLGSAQKGRKVLESLVGSFQGHLDVLQVPAYPEPTTAS